MTRTHLPLFLAILGTAACSGEDFGAAPLDATGAPAPTFVNGSDAGTGGGAAAPGGVLGTGGSTSPTTPIGTDPTAPVTPGTGGAGSGGPDTGGPDTGGPGGGSVVDEPTDRCANASLTWRSARKTNYTSYPEPNSEECIVYNGCTWAGYFAGCSGQQPEAWIEKTNLTAFFSTNFSYESMEHHELCIRSGDKTMIVTVYDTCADSDCSGCCTKNQASNDALIDLESYTNARWGLPDGIIEWADLGELPSPECQ